MKEKIIITLRKSKQENWAIEATNFLDVIVARGYYLVSDAGWSSLVARRAHNPEVAGSNPAPATTF